MPFSCHVIISLFFFPPPPLGVSNTSQWTAFIARKTTFPWPRPLFRPRAGRPLLRFSGLLRPRARRLAAWPHDAVARWYRRALAGRTCKWIQESKRLDFVQDHKGDMFRHFSVSLPGPLHADLEISTQFDHKSKRNTDASSEKVH